MGQVKEVCATEMHTVCGERVCGPQFLEALRQAEKKLAVTRVVDVADDHEDCTKGGDNASDAATCVSDGDDDDWQDRDWGDHDVDAHSEVEGCVAEHLKPVEHDPVESWEDYVNDQVNVPSTTQTRPCASVRPRLTPTACLPTVDRHQMTSKKKSSVPSCRPSVQPMVRNSTSQTQHAAITPPAIAPVSVSRLRGCIKLKRAGSGAIKTGKLKCGFIEVGQRLLKQHCKVSGLMFNADQPDVFFHVSDCRFEPNYRLEQEVTFLLALHEGGRMLQAKDVRLL